MWDNCQEQISLPANHSVTGGPEPALLGLGVRAVRAGSIGREDPRLEENTASPKWGLEVSPALSTKIQRLMIPSGPAGPQAGAPLGLTAGPLFIATGTLTEWLPFLLCN